mmetsp:Transcript_74419/g.91424  ORF Transcript_74419/g.91424 Transcript_74419/m.91424 type:complete len:85 (+) Transcript_74419:62-316(+)
MYFILNVCVLLLLNELVTSQYTQPSNTFGLNNLKEFIHDYYLYFFVSFILGMILCGLVILLYWKMYKNYIKQISIEHKKSMNDT